jgi:hypothetical protein
MTEAKKKVEDLQVGDKVDLTSCPYLSKHPTAEFELAVVEDVAHETDCIAVSYEGIDQIGYPVGTELIVSSLIETEQEQSRG